MQRRMLSATLFLLLAALACNFPGSTSQPTSTPAPSAATAAPDLPATPTSAPPASPTAGPDPAATAETPEPPPPTGLLEVFEANVASGAWTYEEGLVLGLKGLVGEAGLAAEFGPLGGAEGTGIVLEAQRYLREGEDEAARAEISRLLSILLVDQARLAPFSEPEPGSTSTGRSSGLAAPAPILQDECAGLWADGFPANTPVLCFLFKQQTLGSHQTRIYYPSWWEPGGVEFSYAQAAHEALAEAWPHFQQYGAMGTIDLVFTILPESDASTLAMVPQSGIAPERCLVLVYPVAIQFDLANPSSIPLGSFKQTIAHELFHCFQAFNYPDKFVNSSWAVHDWWGESTAEYFSNVVYPGVNAEWRWSSAFDGKALVKSTFEMSYENFEFFQHLANRTGDAAVIGLLGSLPAGNAFADQVAALAAFPEIQAIYHEFGQAYLDHQVTDTSGAPIPGSLVGCCPTKSVGSNAQETVILTAQPFTLALKQLVFLEERIYANAITAGAVAGERSARIVDVQLGWLDDLPEQVIAGCGVEPYRVLLTSTAVSASPYEMTVVVTVEKEIGCDECLIGTWELNKASFEAHMEALLANPDFGVNFIEGGWRYDYSPTGVFTGTFTDFIFDYTITTDDAFGNPIFTDVELYLDGEGTGSYYVDSPGILLTTAPQGGITYLQTIWMNGDLIAETDLSEGGGLFSPIGTSASEYTCSGDVLSIRSEPLDLPQNTPVDYDRVDE